MAKKKIKHVKEDVSLKDVKQDSNYPVFCFKHLQNASIKNCNDKVFRQFIERATKLGELGWNEIHKSDKHSFGSEPIKREQIKCQLPAWVTSEVKLHVFRYSGDNKPFIVTRSGNVLHVLFIEAKFGDIYDHGKK